jgi:hypothetical protein
MWTKRFDSEPWALRKSNTMPDVINEFPEVVFCAA